MKSSSTKVYSSKQENMIASYLGWKVVTGSGSRDCHPGDIVSDSWMCECKTHMEPGHKIVFLSSVWNKISEEASSKFKYPVLFVDDGSQKIENTWCLFKYRSVCLDTIRVLSYPSNIDKNINFDSDKMKTYIKRLSNSSDECIVVSVSMNQETLGITTLECFRNMFGD